jgi:hypothetical protein
MKRTIIDYDITIYRAVTTTNGIGHGTFETMLIQIVGNVHHGLVRLALRSHSKRNDETDDKGK